MFWRKKQSPVKKQPELLHEIAMRNKLSDFINHFDADHARKVRICCDILSIRDRITKAEETIIKQSSELIAELHFMSAALDEAAACLQGDTETEPLQLTSAVSNGAGAVTETAGEGTPAISMTT